MRTERVVSLLPSATEIVAALGCGERLVGRSHECDYPGDVERLPACTAPRLRLDGSSREIDARVKDAVARALAVYEVDRRTLEGLSPDVIVTQDQCEVCAVSLDDVERAVGGWTGGTVRIVSLRATSLDGVYDDVGRVAAALGVGDAGTRLVADMDSRLDAVARSVRGLGPRTSVACIEWTDPLMAAGNWVPELVERAGGRDVFGTAGEQAPWIEWEALVRADPDAIVFMPCGFGLERTRAEARALAERPGWDALEAVQAGRVFVTDASSYFNRPGPRLADSGEILAEMLWPDEFGRGHRGDGWEVLGPA